MELKKILAPPLYYDEGSQMILDEKGVVLDVRMWGRLTGTGAMNLPSDQAMKIQDAFGRFVTKLINDSIDPTKTNEDINLC